MQYEIFDLVSDPGTNMLLLALIIFSFLILVSAVKWRIERPSFLRLTFMVIGYIVFSFGMGIVLTYLDAPPGLGMSISDMSAGGSIVAAIGLFFMIGGWCVGGKIIKGEISTQRTGSIRIRTIEEVTEKAARTGLLVSGGTTPTISCPKCYNTFELTPEILALPVLKCTHCGKPIDL